jgi:hypothetical protein
VDGFCRLAATPPPSGHGEGLSAICYKVGSFVALVSVSLSSDRIANGNCSRRPVKWFNKSATRQRSRPPKTLRSSFLISGPNLECEGSGAK